MIFFLDIYIHIQLDIYMYIYTIYIHNTFLFLDSIGQKVGQIGPIFSFLFQV